MNKRILTRMNKYNYFSTAGVVLSMVVWFILMCMQERFFVSFLQAIPLAFLAYAIRERVKKTLIVLNCVVLLGNVVLLGKGIGGGVTTAAGRPEYFYYSLAAAVCCLAALIFMKLFVYEGEEVKEAQPKDIVRVRYVKGMTATVADLNEGQTCPRCGEEYTSIQYISMPAASKKRSMQSNENAQKCDVLQHEGGLCRSCHFAVKKRAFGIADLFAYLFGMVCFIIFMYPAYLIHKTGSQNIASFYLALIPCGSIGCILAFVWMLINKFLAAEWRGVRLSDAEYFHRFIWQLKRDKRNDPNRCYLSENAAKKRGLISGTNK